MAVGRVCVLLLTSNAVQEANSQINRYCSRLAEAIKLRTAARDEALSGQGHSWREGEGHNEGACEQPVQETWVLNNVIVLVANGFSHY
jgi:hypothetical protein